MATVLAGRVKVKPFEWSAASLEPGCGSRDLRSRRAGTIPRSDPAKSALCGFRGCLLKPAAGAHAKITEHIARSAERDAR